ncbi:uncharacterized protein si:dkey-30j10.5 [Anabas testudineus]|uniref:uncharacterized protein si:dkey-30j10.5 n=1 Tax=Anabas testudineus TaxID=64144 RepID=UPI000E456021|nr:uncharacterized protein si:dkey-30j10.5 [Anabas testudineus]
MSQYITELQVSLTEAEEERLEDHDFTKISVNLNQGTNGNRIYLWYKRGNENPITRIQFSFTDDMNQGLSNAGFTKIDKNLNTGTRGDQIYLWFNKVTSHHDVPIVDLRVTTEAAAEAPLFGADWERLASDLNWKAGGKWIHLWVKREKKTYICDITANNGFEKDAENFQKGYIRVDEDTNTDAGGEPTFIWYRQTTDSTQGLTDLQVSINDEEYRSFQEQQYELVDVDLNKNTGGDRVYLWYKKGDPSDPIRAVSVIINKAAVGPFQGAGVKVIQKNLNIDNKGDVMYLCYYA